MPVGRIILLLIVVAAVVGLALAVFSGDPPPINPTEDLSGADSGADPEMADPGKIDEGPPTLVTATGRVVRMGSLEPMPKVKVGIGRSEALSEADGAFSLLEVPAGEVEVRLVADGFPPHTTRLSLSATDPDLGEIAFPSNTLFTGQVTGPGGMPVSGAVVRVLERTRVEVGTWWSGPKYEQLKLGTSLMDEGEDTPGDLVTTDGEGRFEVKGLSPGKYYFDVVAKRHAHSGQLEVELAAGGTVHRDVVLAEGGAIRGKVLDARRKGVGSARIMALPWDQAVEVPYAPILKAASGPDGDFEIPGLALGEQYLILARAPDGKIGLGIRISVPTEEVELRVGPRFSLTGTVVDDETGAAITGATLFALLGSAKTDGNGRYLLEGVIRSPFFRYVWISAEGYEDKQHEFDLAGSILGRSVIEEDFRLSKIRPGTLRITARDLDGNPLSGVALIVTEWGSEKSLARGVTRGTGEAVLADVPPSAQQLKAMKPGHVLVEVNQTAPGERYGTPTDSVWIRVAPGGESAFEVTLARAATASGSVIDQDGKALAGVTINSHSGESHTVTDEKGKFTVERLPAGVRVGIGFIKEGYLNASAQVGPGSGQEVVVTMVRGGTLTGRVTAEDGKPLAGVEVTARPGEDGGGNQRATTGADGSFALSSLDAGRYVLLAQRDGYAPQKSPGIEIRAGETREGIELVLGKGIPVTVVATLEDGTEVPASAVVYGPLDRPAQERVVFRQADRGEQRMEFRLLPGRYRILATPLAADSGAGAVEQDFDLIRKGTVRVTLATGGVGILIQAKVPEGRHLVGMNLTRTEPKEPAVSFWFQTQRNGVLRSPPLPPGKYTVTVYAQAEDGAWYGREIENLSPSDRPVVVDLTKE